MAGAPACAAERQAFPMNTTSQVAARLLPDGQLVIPGATPDPVATWQILDSIEQEGVTMCVVRAELAAVSWTTLIPAAALERPEQRCS